MRPGRSCRPNGKPRDSPWEAGPEGFLPKCNGFSINGLKNIITMLFAWQRALPMTVCASSPIVQVGTVKGRLLSPLRQICRSDQYGFSIRYASRRKRNSGWAFRPGIWSTPALFAESMPGCERGGRV